MSKAQLTNIHAELESIGVIVGKDHDLFAPHLTIDETELANDTLGQNIQNGLSKVERATNFVSGQIHVSAIQQEVASAGITTNLMKYLSGQETNLTERAVRDLGLNFGTVRRLKGMVQRGEIEVNGGDIKLSSGPPAWPDPIRWRSSRRKRSCSSRVICAISACQAGVDKWPDITGTEIGRRSVADAAVPLC